MTAPRNPNHHRARQPFPNEQWCVGCSPENCTGCRTHLPTDKPDETACILSPGHMRTILLGAGYTVKPGESDLKPYVYAAARALIRDALAMQAQIPAPPEAKPAVAPCLYHFYATSSAGHGSTKHSDGVITCAVPLTTADLYTEVQLQIARVAGLAHAPEKVTICSLTLLNPTR